MKDYNIIIKIIYSIYDLNSSSWNAIIIFYSQIGHPHEALAFSNKLRVLGIKPNSIVMVNVLPTCAYLLAVEQGKMIHVYAIRSPF